MRSSKHLSIICPLAALLLCNATPQKGSTLLLKNADFNSNSLVNGNLVSVLRGNVDSFYDKAIIKADQSTWYREDGRANFYGNVRIIMDKQDLRCDQMDFIRNEKKLNARGNIDFVDTKRKFRLTGQHAIYFFEKKDIQILEKPVLYQADSTTRDTMVIISKQMSYRDTLKTAFADEDVVITRGLLTAHCQKATFNTQKNIARLRVKPEIKYDIHTLTGDSVNIFFKNDLLKGISVMRNARGAHYDPDSTADTIVTKVKGDSMYMALHTNGDIDRIWTFEDARTTYYTSKDTSTMNYAIGKKMVISFKKGTTGDVLIAGNAESVYYIDDKRTPGKNEASGDSLRIHFNKGKAYFIKIQGAVRGVYVASAQ